MISKPVLFFVIAKYVKSEFYENIWQLMHAKRMHDVYVYTYGDHNLKKNKKGQKILIKFEWK